MFFIAFTLIGAITGALNAKKRGGRLPDILQYAVVYALIGALIGLFATIFIHRASV